MSVREVVPIHRRCLSACYGILLQFVSVGRNAPAGSRVITTNLAYSFQFGDCDGRHDCADKDCEDYGTLGAVVGKPTQDRNAFRKNASLSRHLRDGESRL